MTLSGGSLQIIGTASTTTPGIGPLNVNGGANLVMNATAGGTTTLTIGSFSRARRRAW